MEISSSIRKHPWFTAILLVSALGGAVFSFYLAPPEMGIARRVVGGVIAGVGIAVTIILTRVLGAFSEDED